MRQRQDRGCSVRGRLFFLPQIQVFCYDPGSKHFWCCLWRLQESWEMAQEDLEHSHWKLTLPLPSTLFPFLHCNIHPPLPDSNLRNSANTRTWAEPRLLDRWLSQELFIWGPFPSKSYISTDPYAGIRDYCRDPRQSVFAGVDILHAEFGKIWTSIQQGHPQPSGPEMSQQGWDAVLLFLQTCLGVSVQALSRQTNFSHGVLCLSTSAKEACLTRDQAWILEAL